MELNIRLSDWSYEVSNGDEYIGYIAYDPDTVYGWMFYPTIDAKLHIALITAIGKLMLKMPNTDPLKG